jgi:hypothetical protein
MQTRRGKTPTPLKLSPAKYTAMASWENYGVFARSSTQLHTLCPPKTRSFAGDQSYATNMCLRDEFRHWARYEVELRDNHWIKLADDVDE